MLEKLVKVGIPLAVVGYISKEFCKSKNNSSGNTTNIDFHFDVPSFMRKDISANQNTSAHISQEFYRLKQDAYECSIQKYRAFLDTFEIENIEYDFNAKILEQSFEDSQVTSEVQEFINLISEAIKNISDKLVLAVDNSINKDDISVKELKKLNSYANCLYELLHVNIFFILGGVNKEPIQIVLRKASILLNCNDDSYLIQDS